MRQTTCIPFLPAYAAVRTHIQRLRHRLPSWPYMGLSTMTWAMVPQGANTPGVWGYRRAGLDVRSDRDIDAIFFRKKTAL